MRSSFGIVLGVGVGIIALSVLNHFIVKANPISHTTKMAFALGVVVALIGVALAVRSGAKSS